MNFIHRSKRWRSTTTSTRTTTTAMSTTTTCLSCLLPLAPAWDVGRGTILYNFFVENICFPTQMVAKCCWPELPLPTDAKEVSEWIDAASSCTCYCAMCWIVTSNQKRICPCMWWGRCTGTWQCRAPLFKPTDLIRLKQAPFTEQPETTTTNVTVK